MIRADERPRGWQCIIQRGAGLPVTAASIVGSGVVTVQG
jgi:hypothetical protein